MGSSLFDYRIYSFKRRPRLSAAYESKNIKERRPRISAALIHNNVALTVSDSNDSRGVYTVRQKHATCDVRQNGTM